jgi:hypothetical protein
MPLGYNRKESVISDVTRTGDELPSIVAKLATVSSFWSPEKSQLYPLSKVLRLRVLQVTKKKESSISLSSKSPSKL